MHIFDQDVFLKKEDEQTFACTITDRWSINGNPNGGYLLAVLGAAMREKSDKKMPSIITANYLKKTGIAESRIKVENMAQSRSFNRIQSSLIQDGKEKVRAWATFSDDNICSGDTRYEQDPPDMADLDACLPIPEMGSYTLYGNMDVRLDPCCSGWFSGNLTEISEHKGWISFKDKRPPDVISVMLMADSFPPPVISSQGMVAWVPTVEFSLNIRTVPKTPWLKCRFRSKYITCGLVEEDGELWDENGELVALCRQIAQFRRLG